MTTHHTLSGDVGDLTGTAYDPELGPVFVLIEANSDMVIDQDANVVQVGVLAPTVASDGTWSASLIATNSSNVLPAAGRQYRVQIDYPKPMGKLDKYGDPVYRRARSTTEWFALTADTDLSAIDPEPSTQWLSEYMQEAEALLAQTEKVAASAQGAAALAADLVLSDLGTSDGQMAAVAANPASAFAIQQKAALVAAIADLPVTPAAYGAVGNGIADDTAALAAALATGRTVRLKPGATYKVSSQLTLATAGQVLDGAGAKIKRANQTGTTEWTTLRLTAPNTKVLNLEIDGNKSNYTTAGWATTTEIYALGAHGAQIKGCYIHDFPGEGIQQADADAVVGAFNRLENGNGNGIHYGSSGGTWVGGRVLFNRIVNVNLNTGVGHADGAVVLSNGIGDFLVHGNYLKNAIAGIGSIDSADNLDVTISNNEIRSMTGAAIEGDYPAGTGSANVVIVGNRIYDSIAIKVGAQAATPAPLPNHWLISNNLLSNTAITGNYSRDVSILGNQFVGGGSTFDYINMSAPQKLMVAGNNFKGGRYGVNVGGAVDTLTVRDNLFTGFADRAINLYGGAAPAGVNVVEGNTILRDSAAAGDYAIVVAADFDKFSIKNNDIAMAAGVAGIVISSDNCVVTGNTVRGAGVVAFTILIASGATSNYVGFNQTDAAINDGGTTTTLVQNGAIT